MKLPDISIVICTYNRDKFIGNALHSLTNQTLENDRFEIIVVNNNCTDSTDRIVKKFLKDFPELNTNYVFQTKKGLSAARNKGIEVAQSNIIAYMDDDGEADINYLEVVVDHLNTHPEIGGVGGKVLPIYESEEPKWLNKWLTGLLSIVDHGEQQMLFQKNSYPAGCNMVYRKELLEKVGGFNEALKWRADDKYINKEIRKINDKITYLPRAIVHHNIDAFRVTEKNFIKISIATGRDESIRVRSISLFHYIIKLGEYLFKLGAAFLICLSFILKGQSIKGIYTLKFRWHALIGLLGAK